MAERATLSTPEETAAFIASVMFNLPPGHFVSAREPEHGEALEADPGGNIPLVPPPVVTTTADTPEHVEHSDYAPADDYSGHSTAHLAVPHNPGLELHRFNGRVELGDNRNTHMSVALRTVQHVPITANEDYMGSGGGLVPQVTGQRQTVWRAGHISRGARQQHVQQPTNLSTNDGLWNQRTAGNVYSGNGWTPNTMSSYQIPRDTAEATISMSADMYQTFFTSNENNLGSGGGLLPQLTGQPQIVWRAGHVNGATTSNLYSGARIAPVASSSTGQQAHPWEYNQGISGLGHWTVPIPGPSRPIVPSNGGRDYMHEGMSDAMTFDAPSNVRRTATPTKEKRKRAAHPYSRREVEAVPEMTEKALDFPHLFCRAGSGCNQLLTTRKQLGEHVVATHSVYNNNDCVEPTYCPWEGCNRPLQNNSIKKHMKNIHGKILPKD